MSKAEELAKLAEARAAKYRQEAACKKPPDGDADENSRYVKAAGTPGSGKGATPEQWPDGACGCGVWGSR